MIDLSQKDEKDALPLHLKVANQHFEKGYVLEVWAEGKKAAFTRRDGTGYLALSAKTARKIIQDVDLVSKQTTRCTVYESKEMVEEKERRKLAIEAAKAEREAAAKAEREAAEKAAQEAARLAAARQAAMRRPFVVPAQSQRQPTPHPTAPHWSKKALDGVKEQLEQVVPTKPSFFGKISRLLGTMGS